MEHRCFMLVLLLLLLGTFAVVIKAQLCADDKDTCDSIRQHQWQDEANLEDYDGKFLLGWLKSQTKKVVTFCPAESQMEEDKAAALRIIKEPMPCQAHQKTEWNGNWDKKGLPKGQGKLNRMKQSEFDGREKMLESDASASERQPCVDLSDGLDNFQGFFNGGVPSGLGTATLEYDLSTMHGNLVRGAFNGRVQLSRAGGLLTYLGVYRAGRADGPGWLFPPDWERNGFVQAFFVEGEIEPFPVFLVKGAGEVFVGRLNGSRLEEAKKVKVEKMGEHRCVRYLLSPGNLDASPTVTIKLPLAVKTEPSRGLLHVRSSRSLVFNRIAKTGSQAVTELLVQLEPKNGVKPVIMIKQVEYLMEPPQMVAAFVGTVDAETKPAVFVKHYNFVDFDKYGAFHSPNYINIVRNPIDRIVSWFYYWRAAWNIVERKNAFPNDPLPDPEALRKDFDTCVLTGDPECQYIEGSNVLEYPDHRSQMMAFCGHEPFCVEFNSEQVLQRAKENVEKHYAVVGVLEDINKTLSVLEGVLPDVFEGSTELYHASAKVQRKQNKNRYKLPVAAEVMEMVKKNFTREIEFYEFVKERLNRQHRELLQPKGTK